MKHRMLWLILPLSLVLGGCITNQTNMNANVMDANEAQQAVRIQRGVVLAVEEVTVTAEGTPGATIIGSILGAGLGSEIGGGSGRNWAMGAGAVIGGALGEKATQYNEKAFAYIVELQGGRQLQIVQQGALISPNTPVFVKHLGGGRAVVQVDTSQGAVYNRTRDTRYAN
ncbi:hypothetical protein DV711_14875 [Motiliproteus coralliicola]|uniref:Glycine zipper 2TM domain-containing protein n=1 Tax=Motiliproteus coralliicola TaxID=2283196 RepID=A0A369WHG3_9GAMM|nr:hypothetical protein [Motiliproteus coralliicola]RDE18895.1 hypothetical protein DV711_14875 [Motiliproteus coralliicola]